MTTSIETLNPIKIETVKIIDRTGKLVYAGINDIITLILPEDRVKLGLDSCISSAKQNYEMVKNFLEKFFSDKLFQIKEIKVWSAKQITVGFILINDAIISCDLKNFMLVN